MSEDCMNHVLAAREKLVDFIAKTKESQSKIAKAIGVSKTALSQFLSGNYAGNNDELAKKTEQYIEMGTVRESIIEEPGICLTVGNTKEILQKIKIAHVYSDILLIYGPAGCGKSTALKHYAQQNNGVIYVEADVTTNTQYPLLELILLEMGEETKGSAAKMMRTIIKKLSDTKRLLIIDEAQHLTSKSFDMIRAINDKAKIGIVYAGNPKILKRMYGRQEEELDQLFSRVTYKCELKNTYTEKDISGIYSAFDFDAGYLKYLCNVSRRRGGLRIMVKQCRMAQNMAAALHEELSTAHLDDAATRMGNIIV